MAVMNVNLNVKANVHNAWEDYAINVKLMVGLLILIQKLV